MIRLRGGWLSGTDRGGDPPDDCWPVAQLGPGAAAVWLPAELIGPSCFLNKVESGLKSECTIPGISIPAKLNGTVEAQEPVSALLYANQALWLLTNIY